MVPSVELPFTEMLMWFPLINPETLAVFVPSDSFGADPFTESTWMLPVS